MNVVLGARAINPLVAFYYIHGIKGRSYSFIPSWTIHENIHTYHSCFIPEGVAEASQIFLRDAQVLPKLFSYKFYCRCDRW
jgi:hypothetical protein